MENLLINHDFAPAGSEPAASASARKKVLLVDDAELLIDLEKSILASEDLDLLTAANGCEALERIAAERPDLIFLDMYMPVMNGDECCRRIKEDPRLKTIPVIMVTGSRDEDCRKLCEAAGCDAILLKPVDRQKMVEITRTYLSIEARDSQRVPVRMRIRYGIGGKILTDFAVNLSTGGIYLETQHILPEKTVLQISFELPNGGKHIYCRGRVAWVNSDDEGKVAPNLPAGMGIQFFDLGLTAMNAIREYLLRQEIRSDW